MKVLHLISSLDYGGAELLLLDVIQNNTKQIHLMIVSNRIGPLFEKIESAKVTVYIEERKGFDLKFIRRLRTILIQNSVDIIHAHGASNFIHALIAAYPKKIKFLYTVHGYSLLHGNKIIKNIIFNKAHVVNFVSNTVLLDYLKDNKNFHNLKQNQFRVIYNGIAANKFIVNNSDFRNEICEGKDDILLGMIGNFNHTRDHFTICRAIEGLAQKNRNFHFIFAGRPQITELYLKCYNFCKDKNLLSRVHFLGARSDIPAILSSLDIFVYSSFSDTFGIAVVEAMMSGTPVVVNNLPVFQEITDNGKYASLYKTKDVSDLVDKIEYLMDHPEERKRLGVAGKKWAIENFSIQRHIEQLQEIYTEVLSRK